MKTAVKLDHWEERSVVYLLGSCSFLNNFAGSELHLYKTNNCAVIMTTTHEHKTGATMLTVISKKVI